MAESAPSNTTGSTESMDTKDKEIAELQAKLAALQQAANKQVPSSDLSQPENKGVDPDLAALDLNWGDFDPAFIRTLNQNKEIRDAFIAAQTLAADSTQCMDDGKLVPKTTFNKKRARGDQDQLVTTLNLVDNPDEAIMAYFTKYHNSTILPQLEMFRSGASQLWETQAHKFSMQTRQMISLQQQLALLETERSRRTILMKNLPTPLLISELKTNLSTLLYKAGVSETSVQDKVNHFGMGLGTVVFVVFNSEAAAGFAVAFPLFLLLLIFLAFSRDVCFFLVYSTLQPTLVGPAQDWPGGHHVVLKDTQRLDVSFAWFPAVLLVVFFENCDTALFAFTNRMRSIEAAMWNKMMHIQNGNVVFSLVSKGLPYGYSYTLYDDCSEHSVTDVSTSQLDVVTDSSYYNAKHRSFVNSMHSNTTYDDPRCQSQCLNNEHNDPAYRDHWNSQVSYTQTSPYESSYSKFNHLLQDHVHTDCSNTDPEYQGPCCQASKLDPEYQDQLDSQTHRNLVRARLLSYPEWNQPTADYDFYENWDSILDTIHKDLNLQRDRLSDYGNCSYCYFGPAYQGRCAQNFMNDPEYQDRCCNSPCLEYQGNESSYCDNRHTHYFGDQLEYKDYKIRLTDSEYQSPSFTNHACFPDFTAPFHSIGHESVDHSSYHFDYRFSSDFCESAYADNASVQFLDDTEANLRQHDVKDSDSAKSLFTKYQESDNPYCIREQCEFDTETSDLWKNNQLDLAPPYYRREQFECQYCKHTPGQTWRLNNRPKLMRHFPSPIRSVEGRTIYRAYNCCAHIVIHFVRRGQFYVGCFHGKIARIIKGTIEKVAPSYGEPGRRVLNPDQKQFFSSMTRFTKLRPADEDLDTSGGNVPFNRAKARRAYRQYRSIVGKGNIGDVLPAATPQSVSPDLRTLMDSSLQNRMSCNQDPVSVKTKAPRSKHWRIMTFNVENLRSVGKHFLLTQIMLKFSIDILCIQETHVTCHDEFHYQGFRFLLSGNKDNPHAGVGFVVSPKAAKFIKAFKPVNARIAILKLNTSPRPFWIYSCYAPSQMVSVAGATEADANRKNQFWEALHECTPIDSCQLPILFGDFNARINSRHVDPPYIGPHIFHRAEQSDSPFLLNSDLLFEFLHTNLMFLPASFMSQRKNAQITYLEINSSELASTNYPNEKDFAQLDHILLPLYCTNMGFKCSNLTDVAFPSRHFPVIGTFNAHSVPIIQRKHTSDRFFAPSNPQKICFQNDINCKLRVMEANSTNLPLSFDFELYTDGSCPDNVHVGSDNPAGWGFCFRQTGQSEWIESYGLVSTDPTSINYLGADVGSNNTAEIHALMEALDFVGTFVSHGSVAIYTDSEYSLNLLLGLSSPTVSVRLAAALLANWTHYSRRMDIHIFKVAGHSGIEGNENADRLAALALSPLAPVNFTGRFSSIPPRPLRTFSLPPTPTWFLDLGLEEQYKLFTEVLHSAACNSFSKIKGQQQKSYFSPETFDKIEAYSRLRSSNFTSRKDRNFFIRDIRRAIKKDKLRWIQNQLHLEHRGGPSERWKQIRTLRRTYQPTPSVVKNAIGICDSTDKLNTIAEYFASHIWNKIDIPPVPLPNLKYTPSLVNIGLFTFEELNAIVSKIKTNKSPGSDKISSEWIKWSSVDFKQFLLSHLNQCFVSCAVPKEWTHSLVAMLPKPNTQDPLSPGSYRPISLTQSLYKIYAALLRSRLQLHVEAFMRPQQFGFRPRRSTSQPIHILRRCLEIFERSSDSLHLVFLDWSKAFDSLHHHSIREALIYYGVPEPLVNAIMSLYATSSFQVKDRTGLSRTHQQGRGVRQGCPLSPYLFTIVLSHLMEQVDSEYIRLHGTIPWVFSAASPLWDIEYADDTVIMGRSYQVVTSFLNILIPLAKQKGLALNLKKCEHLPVHSKEKISIEDPDSHETVVIPTVRVVKYLGVLLTPNSNSGKEIGRRLTQAKTAHKLLRPFFTHKHLSLGWKLTVYQQIIGSILTYGLESLAIDVTHFNKLDAFHFKVIRQCLGVKSTFFSKVISPTDNDVSNKFYHKMLHARGFDIRTPSQKVQARSLKLLGHITRHPEELISSCTFHSNGSARRLNTTLRVGAPRLHWSELTTALAQRRILLFDQFGQSTSFSQLDSDWFRPITRDVINNILGPSVSHRFDNTSIHRSILVNSHGSHWNDISC